MKKNLKLELAQSDRTGKMRDGFFSTLWGEKGTKSLFRLPQQFACEVAYQSKRLIINAICIVFTMASVQELFKSLQQGSTNKNVT